MRDALLSYLLLLGGGVSAWFLIRHYRRPPGDINEEIAPVSYVPPSFTFDKWTPPAHAAPYLTAFADAERLNGLPKNLLARMAQQESNFNPNARGTSGEVGIMQIIPKWHPGIDAANPFSAIAYAGRLMRQHYNRFGTWAAALAAYNWGPTALNNYGLDAAPASTKRYIAAIASDVVLT